MGQGVKTALQYTLEAVKSDHPDIGLFDEPTSSIHPSDQHLVATTLTSIRYKQMFISTHSLEFVLEYVKLHKEQVQIIRLVRPKYGDNVHGGLKEDDPSKFPIVYSIGGEELMKLWKYSFIWHTTYLNALFYDEIILCEADTDIAFYKLFEEFVTHRRTLFFPAFSKSRMKELIKPLQVKF